MPTRAAPQLDPPRSRQRRRRAAVPYLMLRPALLLELLVHLVPMVVGVWMPTWPTPSA